MSRGFHLVIQTPILMLLTSLPAISTCHVPRRTVKLSVQRHIYLDFQNSSNSPFLTKSRGILQAPHQMLDAGHTNDAAYFFVFLEVTSVIVALVFLRSVPVAILLQPECFRSSPSCLIALSSGIHSQTP